MKDAKQDQSALRPEALMTHLRALCEEIGPRPPTSPQEREAANYVRQTLHKIGVQRVDEQRFQSQSSMGWITVPIAVLAALAIPVAARFGRWGKALGGLMLLLATRLLYDFSWAKPSLLQKWIERGSSQNVIARVAPTGSVKHTLYLVGHLDTNKQRFSAPPPAPQILKGTTTFATVLGAATSLSLLRDAIQGRESLSTWQKIAGVLLAAYAPPTLDEIQPHVEGANDNGSAVAVMLGIAEALQRRPLKHTEVVLLFTGCEEVICVGMEAYLEKFAPPRDSTYWIDLEVVGTGDLCFVTRHGVSYLAEYGPHPELLGLAEQTARKNPGLNVRGRDMLMVEEVANLRRRNYKAICLAGYGADGFIPNWHRLSDNLGHIEPETLSRAARFTWAMMQELDSGRTT